MSKSSALVGGWNKKSVKPRPSTRQLEFLEYILYSLVYLYDTFQNEIDLWNSSQNHHFGSASGAHLVHRVPKLPRALHPWCWRTPVFVPCQKCCGFQTEHCFALFFSRHHQFLMEIQENIQVIPRIQTKTWMMISYSKSRSKFPTICCWAASHLRCPRSIQIGASEDPVKKTEVWEKI